jgi:hypothetical protein
MLPPGGPRLLGGVAAGRVVRVGEPIAMLA